MNLEDNTTFLDYLNRMVARLGISDKEIANIVDASPSSVGRWRNRETVLGNATREYLRMQLDLRAEIIDADLRDKEVFLNLLKKVMAVQNYSSLYIAELADTGYSTIDRWLDHVTKPTNSMRTYLFIKILEDQVAS